MYKILPVKLNNTQRIGLNKYSMKTGAKQAQEYKLLEQGHGHLENDGESNSG